MRGESVTVGPPYFNFFLRVFGLPLLLLMGIGPLVAWRRASIRSLKRMLAWPALVALVTGGVLLVFGAGSSLPGLVTYTFCAFVLASIVIEFAKGTQARRALSGGSWLARVLGSRRRGTGGATAATSSMRRSCCSRSASRARRSTRRRVRRSSRRASRWRRPATRSRTASSTREARSNHTAVRAHVDVYRDGELVTRLQPGKNRYAAEQQVSNEMAIYTSWLRAEDVDVIADQVNADGSVYFKVLVKPLVNLIWLAGFVFVAGLADRALAGRAREPPVRRALRAGRRGGEGMTASTWALRARRRCSRRRAPSTSLGRSCASRPWLPADDRLDAARRSAGASGWRSSRSAIVRSPR